MQTESRENIVRDKKTLLKIATEFFFNTHTVFLQNFMEQFSLLNWKQIYQNKKEIELNKKEKKKTSVLKGLIWTNFYESDEMVRGEKETVNIPNVKKEKKKKKS